MLEIKEISSYKKFRDMREAWDDLISRSKVDNIFLTHDWMDSYIRNCCNGNRLVVLTVFDGEILVGIAPLMIRRYDFMGAHARSVCFIGTTVSDRMDFILDAPRERCVPPIMDYLMEMSADWDFLDFQEMATSFGTVELIQNWVKSRRLKYISSNSTRSFFIKLDSDSELFLKRNSKKLHRKIKKSNSNAWANLKFRRYAHDEVKENLFRDIEFISKRSWKGRRQKSVFLKDYDRDFHREMFFKTPGSGCLDISILRMNNIPIAYIYNFLHNNRIYNYSVEFDSRYSYLSPGTMLMLWNIEDSIPRGIREIDFGRGEEKWKTRFTQDFRTHGRVRIFKKGFYGRVLYLLCMGFKCVKENIKKNTIVYRILKEAKQRFL